MAKKNFKVAIIVAVYCFLTGVFGLVVPNTTTPWFWFSGTGVSIVLGIKAFMRLTKQKTSDEDYTRKN